MLLTFFSVSELSCKFFCKPSRTSPIKFPINSNSFSLKPLVVPAGVPNLTPEVTQGFSGSKGTPFLLHVKPALSKLASASLPVNFFGLKSTKARWVSVPPETISTPS